MHFQHLMMISCSLAVRLSLGAFYNFQAAWVLFSFSSSGYFSKRQVWKYDSLAIPSVNVIRNSSLRVIASVSCFASFHFDSLDILSFHLFFIFSQFPKHCIIKNISSYARILFFFCLYFILFVVNFGERQSDRNWMNFIFCSNSFPHFSLCVNVCLRFAFSFLCIRTLILVSFLFIHPFIYLFSLSSRLPFQCFTPI